jgi:histidinol-phosphate/aromatic aminotransferase/cobyric acid decarboxylase-like protein
MSTPEHDRQRHLFYETSHSPALADLLGGEEAARVLDFCFIANPYYPTPAMMRELQDQLPSLIASYPSARPARGARHLARVLDVDPDHLLVGNGATELITVINETLIERMAVPVPTFSEYVETLHGRRAAELYPLNPARGFELDPGAYLDWIRERGLRAALIINPGNPTGRLLPLEAMRDFLRAAGDLELVIVDESFIDFAGDPIPSLLHDAGRFSNLLIVRSMGKHCGVPGLRLGYACTANLYLLNRLRLAIPIWNVNTIAEFFLSLLPATDADYHAARRRVMEDVRLLYGGLGRLAGLHPYPTAASFVLAEVRNGMTASELQMKLLRDHRMYIRDCTNKIGIDAYHVRIATRGREKDGKLLDVLAKLCA